MMRAISMAIAGMLACGGAPSLAAEVQLKGEAEAAEAAVEAAKAQALSCMTEVAIKNLKAGMRDGNELVSKNVAACGPAVRPVLLAKSGLEPRMVDAGLKSISGSALEAAIEKLNKQ